MPSAQKSTTPVGIDIDIVEGRYAELGEYTVGVETFKRQVDTAPYFRGLPDDRCPCEHIGCVTAGQITFRYADRQETFVEGDAYLAPPGHLTTVTPETSVVEFTRTTDLASVMETIGRNLEAMTAGATS